MYPIKCNVSVKAIFAFRMVFIFTGEVCNIQTFLPSKEIDDAAGQLSESIEAIKRGAKVAIYPVIFSTPELALICSTELYNK